jgi:hypothetical protein
MNLLKRAAMTAVAAVVLSVGPYQSILIGMLSIAGCWTKHLISKWRG